MIALLASSSTSCIKRKVVIKRHFISRGNITTFPRGTCKVLHLFRATLLARKIFQNIQDTDCAQWCAGSDGRSLTAQNIWITCKPGIHLPAEGMALQHSPLSRAGLQREVTWNLFERGTEAKGWTRPGCFRDSYVH